MRFLCLPGYLQSGKILAEKSSGIRKAFTKKLGYELDYIDPPIVIGTPSELPFSLGDGAEAEERWQGLVDKNANRCWWQHDLSGLNLRPYVGFDEALRYVTDYIRDHGPYDGIFGFSQGAAMAAIVSNRENLVKLALLVLPFVFTQARSEDQDRVTLDFDVSDVQEYAKSVRIVPGYEKLYEITNESLQTVVVYGSEDLVVPPIRSKYLASIFQNTTEIVHDGGHLVPNKKPIVNQLVEFVSGRNHL